MTRTLPRRAPAAVSVPIAGPIQFPRVLWTRSRNTKRAIDLVVAIALATVAMPLTVLIAVAILLESGRPVFFAHERIGRGKRRFRVWKFRTMMTDADSVLEDYLRENPERAIEWELSHKLKDDPRITRVGRLLRSTSLDELPQLWNVLRGDMSMVGPRPIVEAEIPKYGRVFHLYTQVLPGLTGLWQVSGRNDTSYGHRIQLDSEYIRHWTPGLDIRVIIKTVVVVLIGKGAY